MSFTNLPTTIVGTTGERIAQAYMERNGCNVYPSGANGPHPVDFIVHNPKHKTVTLVEVKTYPRLYISDRTGIDTRDYRSYLKLSKETNLPFYMIFVDPFEAVIYGALLDDLTGRAIIQKEKVYFPLERFKRLHDLTPKELKLIGWKDVRSRYANVSRHFLPVAA